MHPGSAPDLGNAPDPGQIRYQIRKRFTTLLGASSLVQLRIRGGRMIRALYMAMVLLRDNTEAS